MENKTYKLGIDVGSTTIKIIVLDEADNIVYRSYKRHKANINIIFIDELNTLQEQFPNSYFTVMITGSAGMGIAERTGTPFVQEVVASVEVIHKQYPHTGTLIDLGGEDSKMVFFEEGKQPDIRMNGSCAGGTGAFIDQMSDLMNISIGELDKLALQGKKIYPVASRCGVFAKTDVQNLISRNINTPDVALSIFHAVALQSITTLSRGCAVNPPVVCIGGPLTFLSALRKAFQNILKFEEAQLTLPDNSEYFPAWGCALLKSSKKIRLYTLIEKLETKENRRTDVLPPLFSSETEYRQWKKNRKVKHLDTLESNLSSFNRQNLYLGIDSGSTTTKILIIDEDERIVFNFYAPNQGNPLKKVAEGLSEFEKKYGNDNATEYIVSSCSTGYGEELIQSAFNLDYGIVETVAHFTGAQYVDSDVSFILDIGGQDMKSIFVSNGIISRIELNEACSSGCGSFLQNFASTMNLSLREFTEIACIAQYPADLGTRCTVFMNSKVKQSLRENASIGDIASGLAYSVVKNCLFKVLKINNLNVLGDHIVVQGGTFRNDAVYRALELLSGKTVSSTNMPEMMGAFGAALYAKKMFAPKSSTFKEESSLQTKQEETIVISQ